MGTMCCQHKKSTIEITKLKTTNELKQLITQQIIRVKKHYNDYSTNVNKEDSNDDNASFYYYTKLDVILHKLKIALEDKSNCLEDDTLNNSVIQKPKVKTNLTEDESLKLQEYLQEIFNTEADYNMDRLNELDHDMKDRIGFVIINR